MIIRNRCERCRKDHVIYHVTSPLCMGSRRFGFCPSCFQDGIDAGEIVWLGNSPFGICSEHEHSDHTDEEVA